MFAKCFYALPYMAESRHSVSIFLYMIGFMFPNAKVTSSKKKSTTSDIIFSTVFHALSHGVIHFARSVSFNTHLRAFSFSLAF